MLSTGRLARGPSACGRGRAPTATAWATLCTTHSTVENNRSRSRRILQRGMAHSLPAFNPRNNTDGNGLGGV